MKLIYLNLLFLSLLIGCSKNAPDETLIIQLINRQTTDTKAQLSLPTELMALLDYDQLYKITGTPALLNLNNLRQIKKFNFEMKYDQVIESLCILLEEKNQESSILKAEYLVEYLFAAQNILSYDRDYLEKLESLNALSFNTPVLDIYYKIQYLIAYQDYLKFNNMSFHALSCVDYAMHLLSTSDYMQKLPYLKALLYRIKGSILLNEGHPGAQHTAHFCLEKSVDLFDQLNCTDDKAIALINLSFSAVDSSEIISIDSLISHFEDSLDYYSPRVQQYYLLNIGFKMEDEGQEENAMNYLTRAYDKIASENCSRAFFDISNILALSHIYRSEVEQAEYYASEMSNYRKCNYVLNEFVKFYELEVTHKLNMLKQELAMTMSIDSIINPLFERREKAKNIFINKMEFHLDDFYTQNCSSILNVFHEYFNDSIPHQYHELIINLLADSKKRNLKIKRDGFSMKTKSSGDAKILRRIEALLAEVNDFNVIDNYEHDIYRKLFNAYNQSLEFAIIGSDEKRSFPISILNILQSKKTALIEFLLYGDELFQITYSSSIMRIDKYSWSALEPLLKMQITETIDHESDFSRLNHKKLQHLKLPALKDANHVIINPDNLLANAPIEYIIGLDENGISSSRYAVLDHEDSMDGTYISGNNFNIFSYSDSTTLNSKKIKTMPELFYGFKEAVELNKAFVNSNLICGKNFTKEVFLSQADSEILHVVTHGYSNSQVRQDCYLVARNKNDTTALNLNHLKMITKPPIFVSLSSCDSGTGSYVIGAGIYSLSRAFLELGTQTVLKTLWKIDDKASMEFMISFYTNWKSGISVAEALHHTKQEFKNSDGPYNQPYYWAGFVLEGNPNLFLKKEDS